MNMNIRSDMIAIYSVSSLQTETIYRLASTFGYSWDGCDINSVPIRFNMWILLDPKNKAMFTTIDTECLKALRVEPLSVYELSKLVSLLKEKRYQYSTSVGDFTIHENGDVCVPEYKIPNIHFDLLVERRKQFLNR
jgi:hypothetical protein